MADHQCSASVVAGQQPVPATAMDGDQSIGKLHAGMHATVMGNNSTATNRARFGAGNNQGSKTAASSSTSQNCGRPVST